MERIRSIVVATDFSPLAESAAARAASLARIDAAEVHVVHAVTVPLLFNPYDYALPANLWDELRRAAQEKLEQTRKSLEARGVATVTVHASDVPDAVDSIAAAVREHAADLVVMGTHGRRGIQHAFLGSVTERALRTLDVPVLAVKEDPEAAAKPIAKIALAVDFSPHSDRAVELTADLAARLSASVDVIHAIQRPLEIAPYPAALTVEIERAIEADASQRLEEIRERLERRQIRANTHLHRGHAYAVIADVARQLDCQLIAMGTRGRTGLAHVLLGSVAERTLRAAPCSVLCVRSAGADA